MACVLSVRPHRGGREFIRGADCRCDAGRLRPPDAIHTGTRRGRALYQRPGSLRLHSGPWALRRGEGGAVNVQRPT